MRVGRIDSGAQKFRIALICEERDPLECHRSVFVFVSRQLEAAGVTVRDNFADGSLEAHREVLMRLREKLHLSRKTICSAHPMT